MISPPGTVLTVMIVIAAACSLLYTFFFAFRPWRRDPANRALMLKSCGNLILLGMGAATALFGEYQGREAVRTGGFSVFLAGIVYLLYALLTSPGARNYPPYTWRRRGSDGERRDRERRVGVDD